MASARLLRIVLFALLAASAAAPAAAQGWFGNLFGGAGPRPRPGAPAYPGYGGGGGGGGGGGRGGYGGGSYGGGSYGGRGYGGGGYAPQDDADTPRPRHHVQRRKASLPKDDVAKEAPPPQKNASLFVYVFGDSLAQMLEIGLDDALADRADVAVVHDAKGSSGLVNSEFYDWPKTIDGLLASKDGVANDAKDSKAQDSKAQDGKAQDGKAQDGKAQDSKVKGADTKGDAKPAKIDVGVMMIGTNDKQSIRENGQTLSFGTPEWIAAYTRRVAAIDETFRSHGVPLIWVGVPITKSDDFADAMASLNDITREAASKTGAVYVDTWEAFSDDDGDFSANGPDINGQTVRLRSSDGIHFTKAGARKLAHFVVAHVTRALDGKTPVPRLPTASAPDAGGKAVAAAKPDAGPIRDLTAAPDSKDGMLAALPAKPDAAGPDATVRDPLVATTLVRGEAMPIPAGRADDARWPAQGVPEP